MVPKELPRNLWSSQEERLDRLLSYWYEMKAALAGRWYSPASWSHCWNVGSRLLSACLGSLPVKWGSGQSWGNRSLTTWTGRTHICGEGWGRDAREWGGWERFKDRSIEKKARMGQTKQFWVKCDLQATGFQLFTQIFSDFPQHNVI